MMKRDFEENETTQQKTRDADETKQDRQPDKNETRRWSEMKTDDGTRKQ